MKLKPGLVLLITPVALGFGLWVDLMIAQATHKPAIQQEVRMETVDQPKAGNKAEESMSTSETPGIIAFM